HDFPRCRGDHAEGKATAIQAALQKPDQFRQRSLEPHPAACLDQMLPPHAAKIRVMADEIGQLATLLNEVATREARNLLLETPDAEELTQHVPGIIETQRLV